MTGGVPMTDQPTDPAQQLVNLMKAGQEMWLNAARASAAADPTTGQPDALAAFMETGRKFVELQQSYLQQMSTAWLNYLGVAPPKPPTPESDPRFSSETWRSDARFDALTRAYLAYSANLQTLVEAAPLDDKAKGQLRYAVRQYVEATSPSNFFATNPEAMQLAQETGGRSVAEGMALFFQDLARGRVSMTDEEAFEVGRNVACSEGAVVFENELIQLIQYSPRTAAVHARPLILVPPCINKYYILDLQPENSFVRQATEQGFTVFLISWRNVDAELGHLTWDDYLRDGVERALDVAQEISGADRVNALGFCVGGTLLGSALAVQAAQGKSNVASLTLLTTMLDFSDTGEIGHLVSAQSVAAREQMIGKGGVMPGKELAFVFSSLRANDLIWQYVINSYLKGKKPPAFDLLYWNSDSTNLPGPMFCWYVRNTYLENNLSKPGRTTQCGQPVDFGKIDVPTFIYASRDDHIVPWRSAYASTRLIGGETTFVLGASGHIAGVINPPAKKKRNYWAAGRPGAPADEWLASAQSTPGSWWPAWSEWLATHSGPKKAAPTALGNQQHKPVEPAPGRYVRVKVD
jgi:polyhydroxyalkanoate synthase